MVVLEAYQDISKRYRVRLTRAPAQGETVSLVIKANDTITGFDDWRGMQEPKPQVRREKERENGASPHWVADRMA